MPEKIQSYVKTIETYRKYCRIIGRVSPDIVIFVIFHRLSI